MTDIAEIEDLVERHWRTIITLFDVDPNVAVSEIFAFENRMVEWTSTYSPNDAHILQATIQSVREGFAKRCRQDHLELRRDLGLSLKGDQRTMNILANLETPILLNPETYLHDFWRRAISLPPGQKQKVAQLWTEFYASSQQKLSSFPQEEQDAFFTRIAILNETYMKNYQTNPSLVRQIVGLPAEPPRSPGSQIGEAIVKTAVDATVGGGLSALFRLFR
ncbi:hypothetical protein [Asticcacaulis sp. AC466]|uniref:hypothetical protein n=1 Tax=Asticcacaulis sp. AC466 TaxID=1282362 RepID=UPI0012DF88E7|nr:hypothetical protein [Asticcacaulis sp. AC466]